MSIASTDLQTAAIDTIRCLSMDAVQTANSGHPGTPMALAPIVYQLYNHTMKYDPAHPLWPGRDRFILSCGHASMLLYSILHLTGVKAVDHNGNVLDKLSVSLDDIKKFRQVDSVCAGTLSTMKPPALRRPPDHWPRRRQLGRYGHGTSLVGRAIQHGQAQAV